MYIRKSVFIGLFLAGVGLLGGWMLHESADRTVPAQAVLQDVSTPIGPPIVTPPVRGTTTGITVDPGTGAVSGDSSTVRTTTHVEQTADGTLVGTSEARTYGYAPAAPAPGQLPIVTAELGTPATAPAIPAWSPAPPAAPAAPAPAASAVPPPSAPPAPPAAPGAPSPMTVTSANRPQAATGQALALEIPPFFGEDLFKPLPGAKSRGVAFSEWESYRTDVVGRNIMVTTDDSNVFKDRDGKLNGNTGDTDASGMNVTDATDSVIFGTESADEPPYQTVTQGVVDIATSNPADLEDLAIDGDADDDGDADLPDPGANPEDVPENSPAPAATALPTSLTGTNATSGHDAEGDTDTGDGASAPTAGTTAVSGIPDGADAKQAAAVKQADAAAKKPAATTKAPAATAAVVNTAGATPPNPPSAAAETDDSGGSDGYNDGYDFPYVTWTNAINSGVASAVHTDEGTTLASGQEAVVVGADGYDDDDNRAVGENIIITRDDGNVVLGGTGDVNAQIGDSEQGAVIMGVTRTFFQGGGAY